MQPYNYEDYESYSPETVVNRLVEDERVISVFCKDIGPIESIGARESLVIIHCTILTSVLDTLQLNNISISDYLEAYNNDYR